jgi:two-component system sensor histidine kinase DegS
MAKQSQAPAKDPAADAEADGSAAPGLGARLASDAAAIERELAEIDMLIAQARTEATRHEQKRATLADKVGALVTQRGGEPADLIEQQNQLITLTRRATVMEAQVDLLEGKRKALGRYHESLVALATEIETGGLVVGGSSALDDPAALPANVARVLMAAQEDLRREISRAMHDGPAQSLTNIVLQAQIVERLVASDPAASANEVAQLVAMVQQTLDATKSFIFDVRPMVLDDLGLVPTLRRAARDRGRRAGIPVDFDSVGADRRLSTELESGLFRILDESLSAYLAAPPERVSIRLDWGDQLEARVAARRGGSVNAATAGASEADAEAAAGADVPPALAAMMEDRRSDRRAKVEAARTAALITLPADAWREIQQRAATIGVKPELLSEGGELRLLVDLPPAQDGAAAG